MSGFKEAIRSGIEEYFHGLQRVIEGLTPAEARWQATAHTNHIAWIVWHMARVEDRWVNRYLRETAEVWTADGWADRFKMSPEAHGYGQTIEEVRAMPEIPLADLMAYFEAVRGLTRKYLELATDAELSRECRHPRLGVVTRTWIVGHLLVEESQHTGQAAMIRGMMRGFEA